jgi:hypothetical protein
MASVTCINTLMQRTMLALQCTGLVIAAAIFALQRPRMARTLFSKDTSPVQLI